MGIYTRHKETFDKWYEHINRWEGRGINIGIAAVDDDGVLTNHGVRFDTFKSLAFLFGYKTNTEIQNGFRNITLAQHKEIARYFWSTSGANLCKDERIAAFCAETFWGGGYAALKSMQKAINTIYKKSIKEDGAVGTTTAKVINSISNQSELFLNLCKDMERRYRAIVAAKPIKEKNLKGWLARLWEGDPKTYRTPRAGFYELFKKKAIKICTCCLQELPQQEQ